MLQFFRRRPFDLDGYLAMLPQFRVMYKCRPALVFPWVRDGLEDWSTAILRAERIVGAMTPEQKRDPDSLTATDRTRIACSSGTHVDELESLLEHFVSVRHTVKRMESLTLLQRLKLITGWDRNAVPSGQAGD